MLTTMMLTEILSLVKEGRVFCLLACFKREKAHLHETSLIEELKFKIQNSEENLPALSSQSSYLFPHQKTPVGQCCFVFGNWDISVYAVYA